jgi:hypothetical protein
VAWVSPRTWIVGQIVTAAQLNEVRDSLKAVGDAWTNYTPTPTGITVGNGTLTGVFRQTGKTVNFHIEFVAGSSSTFSGTIIFQMPVNSVWTPPTPIGVAYLFDNSLTVRDAGMFTLNTVGNGFVLSSSNGLVTATAPWTWATNDRISITGTYECV